MINVELLRAAVEWVEAEAVKPPSKREWDQTAWAVRRNCGTACCVAGHICQLAGHTIDWETAEYGRAALATSGETIEDAAAAALGVPTRDEWGADETDELGDAFLLSELFDATNDAADIRRIAEQLAGGPL